MDSSNIKPVTSGPAFRVSVVGSELAEAYNHVYAQLDAEHGVVHVFSADGQIHYLSIPVGRALIEWTDASVLEPQMRMPAFGPGSFDQAGAQMQRMMEGMSKGFGLG